MKQTHYIESIGNIKVVAMNVYKICLDVQIYVPKREELLLLTYSNPESLFEDVGTLNKYFPIESSEFNYWEFL